MNLCLNLIYILFILFFLQTTVASMLRKTYTPNDDEEKNVPILTNIGIQIGIDGNKKTEKLCNSCQNLLKFKTNMHILPFYRAILSFFFIHTLQTM